MIILDTNVISELMRPRPEWKVITWLDSQPRSSIWTTSITVFEIRFGLQLMPEGKRREAYHEGFGNLLRGIDERVAPFDGHAAQQAGELAALRKMQGRSHELRDTMIAGIVLSRHAILATRNKNHFADLSVSVIDPWAA